MLDVAKEREAAIELMATAEILYLTTVDPSGYPYTRAIFNLRNRTEFSSLAGLFEQHRDDLLVYIGTNTSSHKIKQIQANPKAALYYCMPESFHGLMLRGDIEIVRDPSIARALWQEGWERYYPTGPTDPDYTVLKLAPTLARGWHGGAKFEFEIG